MCTSLFAYLLICLFLLLFIHSILFTAASDGLNACYEYTDLTSWWRSAVYPNDDWEHEDICDRHLVEGWYRAVSGAGGDMPTVSPGFNHCGTVYPIWLNGKLSLSSVAQCLSDSMVSNVYVSQLKGQVQCS